ncbi:LysR substrate-binding domain-containing protein [Leisingera daeponensis]|uniref:LysR substrate-binding domain-containing protein n=1 Tax=Leisingera daeponensis TaxID=405746 RepID=UPI001C938804|nr:LysR substrate-binding domain-containing protein [Leisingera daeponensis]MBY6059797.1 hypothetical protein [Leisingera daeponensis]
MQQCRLHVTPLVNEGLFIAGSRKRGFSISHPEKLERVSELPLIQNTHPNAMRIIVDAALSRAGLQSRTEIEVDALDMMIELASRGDYCIIAPYTAIHGHVQDGTLSAAPVENLRVNWQVVTSNSRPVSVAARVFNDMLAARCHALVRSKMWKTGKFLYPALPFVDSS